MHKKDLKARRFGVLPFYYYFYHSTTIQLWDAETSKPKKVKLLQAVSVRLDQPNLKPQ
jgi:hypothetical protein